ncbi:hypothetical protein D8674_035911 [Pyrus ussuriensis x Pyrus communis]|uniref:Uncharacterized protein n=1 Tax=Pyrus ussuriensis x Pyrus communis TaxID=2448454 RepID=A0A5N5GDQ4_9ROSA|nr:hypothetical protein D8674_035911 [Pyrus ussuriensis x Pyrus communis]
MGSKWWRRHRWCWRGGGGNVCNGHDNVAIYSRGGDVLVSAVMHKERGGGDDMAMGR